MYRLTYSIFYILSLLPFWVLHLISDAFYLIVYHLVGYRKKVVMNNLAIAFPLKTEKERDKIARQFYHNLIDTFIESTKMVSISRAVLHKRITANYEVINDLYASGKNVQLHSGHFFNWEFANAALGDKLTYPFVGVYMPISNKVFNKLFYKMRSRFGTKLIASNNFRNGFSEFKDKQYCLALVGDQNPGDLSKAFWIDFFGRKTPFIKGLELGAKTNNTAVVFCHFFPVKRGYYRAELKLLTKEAASMRDGEITMHFVRFMEESIRKSPANYLWSHRRWKHQFRDEFHEQVIDNIPDSEKINDPYLKSIKS